MAAIPKRGATAPPKEGVYRTPDSDGIKEVGDSSPYRRPPVMPAIDISGIDYVPYGGVYENRADDYELDLSASGGAYEQYLEPVGNSAADVYLSSSLYPPLNIEDMDLDTRLTVGFLYTYIPGDVDVDTVLLSGTLTSPLITYTFWPDEDMDLDTIVLSGTLVVVLLTYTFWPDEDMDLDTVVLSGTIATVLLTYTFWPDEDMDVDTIITGGTLV
jgi:hypothetical protein